MAHFAQLNENNVVLQVIVVSNQDCIDPSTGQESEAVGIAFCQSVLGANTIWKQTSYNNRFRRQYASVGGFYYPPLDVFVGPQPYPSWKFNTEDATWYAPVPPPYPIPADADTQWDEEKQEWLIVRGVYQA